MGIGKQLIFACVGVFSLGLLITAIAISSNTFDAFGDIDAYIKEHPMCNSNQSANHNKRASSFSSYMCHDQKCNQLFINTVRCIGDNDFCSPQPIDGCNVKDVSKITKEFLSCIEIALADKTVVLFIDCYTNVNPDQLMMSVSAARIFFSVILCVVVGCCLLNLTFIACRKKNADTFEDMIETTSLRGSVIPIVR